MKSKFTQRKIGVSLIALGFAALISAGVLELHNLHEEKNAAEASEKTAEILTEKIIENKERPAAENTESTNHTDSAENIGIPPEQSAEPGGVSPEIEIGGETYIGILSIPSLYLKWPVNSGWSYDRLKLTPCRYSGSAEDNTLTIAAHNYRYHFRDLTKLIPGDTVIFTDINGKEYLYMVEGTETISPTEIDKVTDSSSALTLFTCNYSGDVRIIVNCTLIEE